MTDRSSNCCDISRDFGRLLFFSKSPKIPIKFPSVFDLNLKGKEAIELNLKGEEATKVDLKLKGVEDEEVDLNLKGREAT